MKTQVIGGGAWGLALARRLALNGHAVGGGLEVALAALELELAHLRPLAALHAWFVKLPGSLLRLVWLAAELILAGILYVSIRPERAKAGGGAG